MKPNLAGIFAAVALPMRVTGCTAPVQKTVKSPVGDVFYLVSAPHRPMTTGEVNMAREVFGNSLNYDEINIFKFTGDRSRSFDGNVYMAARIYSDDYSKHKNLKDNAVFIHELVHVLQKQQGADIVARALDNFIKFGGDYNKSYEYEIPDVLNYQHLNIEQQASIVEDYYYSSRKVEREGKAANCSVFAYYHAALNSFYPALKMPRVCR